MQSAFGVDHGDISKGAFGSWLDASTRGVGGLMSPKAAAKAAKKDKEVAARWKADEMVFQSQRRKAGFPQGPPKSKFASTLSGPTGPK